MSGYRQATLADVPWLTEAVVAAVEQRSGYGQHAPDWHQVLDDVETSQPDLDLGTDMSSPVIKALLAQARKVYRELHGEAERVMTPDVMFPTWDETTQGTRPITRAQMAASLMASAAACKGSTAAAVLWRQAAEIAAGGDAGFTTVTAAGQEQAVRKAA